VSSAPAQPRLLVDGAAAGALPADDRGLLYGDGVFRTVRVECGRAWLWRAHAAKLGRDGDAIGLPIDEPLTDRLLQEARELGGRDDGVLRITLTRGSGPRGYAPPAGATPRRLLQFTPGLPEPPAHPLRVQWCRTALASSPSLAGVKHLGRLEQVLAAAEPAAPAVFERLMRDPLAHPVCGTRTNIFVRRGRELLTPLVDRGGVAGVVRGEILAGRLSAGEGVDRISEARLEEADLIDADELLLTNAVLGVLAVGVLLDEAGRELRRWAGAGTSAAILADAVSASRRAGA
jgi:4-amino-4-deoxychorismate lyase